MTTAPRSDSRGSPKEPEQGVEQDLGRRLEWAAVNHYDTDHPHAHVVLRGVDRDGREVRLDQGYIYYRLP